MRIVTGPSYPVLESALIDEVRQVKSAGPLTPIALIVPSSHLVTGLRHRLVAEAGLPLLNVHFLTFYQLALRLAEERRAAAVPVTTPDVVSDFFCERLLAHVLNQGMPAMRGLAPPNLAPGAAPALWATIRDLKDAAVEPAVALRALTEGHFPADERPSLEALFTLHAAMVEAGRALSVGTADDLTAHVLSWAGQSPWLGRLERVLYYGFYDLTQIQLAFFDAVTARVEATVYFPEADEPAFQFSRRFLERHLTKASVRIEAAPPGRAGGAADGPTVSVMNAVGPEDELSAVCKQILDLVETRGYDFRGIGVVARSLGPYQALIRRLFDQHRIPFATTAGLPVLQSPLVKTLLQLARLPGSGYDHRLVLDLVTSPSYRAAAPSGRVAARPEQWRQLVAELGIRKGAADWARLSAVRPGGPGRPGQAEQAEQAGLLQSLVDRLVRDCRALPARGGMAGLTEAFVALAERHLLLPDEDGDGAGVMTAVELAWEQLRQVDRLGAEVVWEEWVAAFAEVLDRAVAPLEAGAHAGVQVLEAMAARGLSFRALFLIGMNEKAFPRVVREDAFLRDRHRRVLAETLGYKIDEKLTGYDEEQLLFTLLCRSAVERLFLSYQRADDAGRVLAPSPYLEAGRAEAVAAVPRRFAERVGRAPFLPLLLTPREWALHQIGLGRDVAAFLAATGGEAEIFRNAVGALQGIEGDEAGPYDGLTGPLERHWAQLSARGVAPTPLEQYARCPFQYFADQVLRLEPSRKTMPVEPTPLVLGDLCHAILRLAYGRLLEAGWPEEQGAPRTAHSLVRAAAAETFAAHAAQCGAGYPLLWELAEETVAGLVAAVVENDRRDCLDSGFRPAGFEVEAEGILDLLDAADFKGLKVSGRLDRVDRRADPPGWRIVDYKFKHGREILPEDRNLVTAAVRGMRLQPPLYAVMRPKPGTEEGDGEAKRMAGRPPEQVELLFLAPAWEQTVVKSVFHVSEWQGAASLQLKQTLARILAGIRAGQFMILPPQPCDFCEFSPACRRFHGPTERRAYRAAPARELRLLRKQKVDRG